MKNDIAINKHYGQSDMCQKILKALTDAGKDIENLRLEDIAPFEEFHVGGKQETMNLAQLAPLVKESRVLDIGCGIGGPARTLAVEYGCHVTGIDLTREFCLTAMMLSEKVGLAEHVDFQHANALDLPFDDSTFDIVWMQHVNMNIEDKSTLFAEASRVLRPGGSLAIHELMSGNGEDLEFPVFWASEQSLSFLATPTVIKQIMLDNSLSEEKWHDTTDRSISWFDNILKLIAEEGPSGLGTNVIVEHDVPLKAANVSLSLKSGRVVSVQAVFKK